MKKIINTCLLYCFSICACSSVCLGQVTGFICNAQSETGIAAKPTFPSLESARARLASEDTVTYTIPVIVMIFHLGEPVGTGSNTSDEDTRYYIDVINQRFAGVGVDGYQGQDSKIRFVLAQRTPACTPTNGIIRIDASGVPGFQQYGYGNNLQTTLQLEELVPELYRGGGVVFIKTFHKVSGGAFASFDGGPIFLTAPTKNDINPYNYVPTHEMGHVLNLYHLYSGSYPTSNGPYDYTCPANSYNDEVEDTPPTRLYDPYYACSPGAESEINICTGLPFGEALRNLMNYGCNQDRFTPGQIARMRYFLSTQLQGLANSDLRLPDSPNGEVKAMECSLTRQNPSIDQYDGPGINEFQFNDIKNHSFNYRADRYWNYTCGISTHVTSGESYSLTIYGSKSSFGRVYIDFDNSGSFDESSERVVDFQTDNTASYFNETRTITIPETAVLNKKLRMRVIVDSGTTPPTACFLPGDASIGSGEVEDYGIVIEEPSCITLKEGLWTDAEVWSCGRQPNTMDLVRLKHNITIPPDFQSHAKHISFELAVQLIYSQGSSLKLGE